MLKVGEETCPWCCKCHRHQNPGRWSSRWRCAVLKPSAHQWISNFHLYISWAVKKISLDSVSTNTLLGHVTFGTVNLPLLYAFRSILYRTQRSRWEPDLKVCTRFTTWQLLLQIPEIQKILGWKIISAKPLFILPTPNESMVYPILSPKWTRFKSIWTLFSTSLRLLKLS